MIVRILTFVLVGLLVVPLAQDSHPAEAKKKTRWKTVTRTFASTGYVFIPRFDPVLLFTSGPAFPYPATIEVGGLKRGKIKDVNLTLHGFSHETPNHVDVLLVAPNNRDAIVMSDSGGTASVQDLTIGIDDETGADLPSGSLASGTYRPTNAHLGGGTGSGDDNFGASAPTPSFNTALSTFDGGNPNGTWRLFVIDDTTNDVGIIDGGWSLEITAKVKKKKKR
jgi:hypothetical protein